MIHKVFRPLMDRNEFFTTLRDELMDIVNDQEENDATREEKIAGLQSMTTVGQLLEFLADEGWDAPAAMGHILLIALGSGVDSTDLDTDHCWVNE